MSALDQNALLLEYGNVYVGDNSGSVVDLGSVRNVKFTGVQNPVDIKSDNRGTIVRKNRLNGQVAFDWLEAGDMTKVNELLKGIITLTSTAGSLVSGATQAINGNDIAYNEFVLIEHQNGDGSAISITSVVASTDGALVADTDYVKVKNAQGEYGIAILNSSTVTTLNQTFTITYNYTPNTAKKITGGTSKVATARYVKIEGPSATDPSKKRIVILESAVIESDFVLPFLDTEEANDVGVVPITLTSDKNTNWSFEDQINP